LAGAILVAAAVVVLLVPAVELRQPIGSPVRVGTAGTLTQSGAEGRVLWLSPEARPAPALRSLRRAGVPRVDVLVLPSSRPTPRAVAAVLARRVEIGRVLVARDPPA
jgi:hypothetical protein